MDYKAEVDRRVNMVRMVSGYMEGFSKVFMKIKTWEK